MAATPKPHFDLISGDFVEDQAQNSDQGNHETQANYVSMENSHMETPTSNHKQLHERDDRSNVDENQAQNYVSLEGVQMLQQHRQQQQQQGEKSGIGNDEASDASTLTLDGIHDFPGFVCVCAVILIGDMSRGVYFPSMWPLVNSLGGSKIFLGYAVASFSGGRILANPLFGSWSHTIGYTKTLLLSCGILLFGTLLYAQVQNVGSIEFLIVAQTVLGIGSGTLGVTRAFVADVTARRNRTTYIALITAVQYGGFTVTPAFGALFNKIFHQKEYRIGLFRLNMYTAPAYFMASVVIATIAVLLIFFKDRQRFETAKPIEKKSQKRMVIDYTANSMTRINLTVYDCCILGCMLLNIATKGSIASFETLGIAIAQEYFGMHASDAGIVIACCGVCGVIALLKMGWLEQRFTDVQIITAGILVMIVGIGSLMTIQNELNNSNWAYVVAMFLIYSIGYPIGHTAVIGLFSKSK